jgi:hypothetical protein
MVNVNVTNGCKSKQENEEEWKKGDSNQENKSGERLRANDYEYLYDSRKPFEPRLAMC